MKIRERIVLVAACFVPKGQRERRREEWLADLDGSEEVGLSSWAVPLGALRFAASARNFRAHFTNVRPRTWAVITVSAIGFAIVAVPGVAVAAYAIDQLRGVVTEVSTTEGATHTVFWRDYPATAEIDPADVLAAPSLEEALAGGTQLIEQIRDELSAYASISWEEDGSELVVHPASNGYGGYSMLNVVNTPSWLGASERLTASQTAAVIDLIVEAGASHGYTQFRLDTPEDVSGFTTGMLQDASSQWVAFAVGEIDWPTEGSQPPTVTLMFGANGLLPEAARAEFEARLEPFEGYTRPDPWVS